MNHRSARFSVGQIVQHRLFDYRGAIFDVDPVFSGTEQWYEQVARSRPPKEEPWYHVMVDGNTHTTYVAERNLLAADDRSPIHHPQVGQLLGRFVSDHYQAPHRAN